MEYDNYRVNSMVELANHIKKEENKMKDIRYREWLKYNTKVSQALLHIINAENILWELDDFSLENDQCYPEIEDFYNQLAALRADITKYVDENPDILNVNIGGLNK